MNPTGDAEAMRTRPLYLGLGSNQGDRYRNLLAALAALDLELDGVEHSAVYESPPWGVLDQPSFLNCCCRADWSGPPLELLRRIKVIEERLGRRPTRRWGERVIDIDILVIGDAVLALPELQVPHPQLARRRFVCQPLADLCPTLVVPGEAGTIQQLAERLAGSESLDLWRAGDLVQTDRGRGGGPA